MINRYDWEKEDMNQLISFARAVRDGRKINMEIPVEDCATETENNQPEGEYISE